METREHENYQQIGNNIPSGRTDDGGYYGEKGSNFNMRKWEWLQEHKELFDEYRQLKFRWDAGYVDIDSDRMFELKKELNIYTD